MATSPKAGQVTGPRVENAGPALPNPSGSPVPAVVLAYLIAGGTTVVVFTLVFVLPPERARREEERRTTTQLLWRGGVVYTCRATRLAVVRNICIVAGGDNNNIMDAFFMLSGVGQGASPLGSLKPTIVPDRT